MSALILAGAWAGGAVPFLRDYAAFGAHDRAKKAANARKPVPTLTRAGPRTIMTSMTGESLQSIPRIDVTSGSRDGARQAADILQGGGVIAFPTETVYGLGACPTVEGALSKLDRIKARPGDKPYTVHLAGPDQLTDYVPDPPWLATVLARKGWPGPITLVVEVDQQQIDKARHHLGEAAMVLFADNRIGLRCPDHPAAGELLRQCALPVVAPSANPSGRPPAFDADQVAEYFTDSEVDLILDGGTTRYRQSSTVVQVDRWSIHTLRAGPLDADAIDRLARFTILFVCTGNTCRSPMAEGLARRALARRLDCDERQLETLKIRVRSAGTLPGSGGPPSPEAIQVMKRLNIDISAQRSQTVTADMINQADMIYVMGEEHRDLVRALAPAAEKRILLLDKTGAAVADPLGQPISAYRSCSERLANLIDERLEELLA